MVFQFCRTWGWCRNVNPHLSERASLGVVAEPFGPMRDPYSHIRAHHVTGTLYQVHPQELQEDEIEAMCNEMAMLPCEHWDRALFLKLV